MVLSWSGRCLFCAAPYGVFLLGVWYFIFLGLNCSLAGLSCWASFFVETLLFVKFLFVFWVETVNSLFYMENAFIFSARVIGVSV